MIWLDSTNQLQFYNLPVNGICYCAILYYANDLTLQGAFPKGTGSYTLQIQTLSPDGNTSYETSTSNFEYYFANNPVTQQHFFNARLKAFTTVMCTRACYILRVTVTDSTTNVVMFDKYTERYCQASCCDSARNITFEQVGITTAQEYAINPTYSSAVAQEPPPEESGKVTECGDALITLRTRFSCYDYFDGYYYATPTETLSGSATFGYEKVTNMRGRIVKRPRSIERTYSYNCRLQRVESQRVYLFEAYEYFPAWAADEIESQLHSDIIYVDDVQYQFEGGAPFSMASECKDIFRLKTTLSDCVQRQVFGCNPDCVTNNFDGAQKMYVIPSAYEEGYFYGENRELIAQSYDELLDYFRGLDGAYSVQEIATSPLSCETYGAFSILSYGYVPNSIYFDYPTNSNRVFGIVLSSVDEICPTYGVTCASPEIGEYYVEAQVCADPVIGEYYVEDDNSEVITINGFGDWVKVDAETSGSVDNGVATISITVQNSFIVENPDSPSAPAYINGDIIAVIGGNGRPDINLTFDSNNSVMTDDNVLTIETNGFVRYFGEATDLTDLLAEVSFVNLTYNITNS